MTLCSISVAQEKVILDTDPGYDPDDVGCMAMLHTMASNGECEILAFMNATDHMESPIALSAINRFYNRPGIPVGDFKGYLEKIAAPKGFYSIRLANTYPSTLENWEDALDAVVLYREILASAEDASVTIVITGTMHNFYGLLRSEQCDYSDLTGKELVGKKVKKVVTMGGNFMNGKGHDRTNWGGSDFLCDYTSWSCLDEERNAMCRYVIENCTAPFMASGWEVGCGDYHDAGFGNVITGPGLKQLDTNHIARVSYEYHFKHRENKTDISRHSNDQCALHYAIRGEGLNYKAYSDGKITLSKKGVCTWTDKEDRNQGYIQKKRNKNDIAVEIESLMMGPTPSIDRIPPSPPDGITFSTHEDRLKWNHVNIELPGSWTIGYNVYLNGRKIGRAHGTQFILSDLQKGQYEIEVKAVNASGTEGRGSSIEINIP